MSEPKRKNRFQWADLRDARTQVRRLAPYALPYWPRMALFLLGTAVYWAGFGGRLFVIKPFVDIMQSLRPDADGGGGTVAKDAFTAETWGMPAIVVLPMVMLLAGIAMAFGTWLKQYQMAWLMHRATIDVQRDLTRHLMRQPISFFNQNRKGELLSRVTNDMAGVRGTFHIVYNDLIHHPIGIGFILAGAIWTSPELSILTLFVPIVLLPVVGFAGKIKRLSKRSYETAAELTTFFHQFFEGVRVVKAFSMEKEQEKELDRAALDYFNRSVKVGKYMGISRSLVEMMMGVLTAAAIAGGLWLAQGPVFGVHLDFGTTLQFAALLMLLYDPVRKLSHTLNHMSEAMAANERVFQMLDLKPTLTDAPDAKPAPAFSREIVFDRVSFEYVPGRPVVRNVSFTAKRGTMTAFVGPTGAGKSTILDLIPRFYPPTSGRVLVDGVDLAGVTASSWLAQIAVVSQENFLFNTSVRDNLLAGKPDATEADLVEALKAANIHDEIMSLPAGLDTQLGDRGVTLSGGQRQRLAIARAFVKRASILLLDEATSALDTETERRVQQALDRLIEGATVFAIAHRLSTISHADQILVIDHGEITERGTHAELLAAGGSYAMLHATQLRGATGGHRPGPVPAEAPA